MDNELWLIVSIVWGKRRHGIPILVMEIPKKRRGRNQRFWRFNSSMAWLAARAVSAMKVMDGFWFPVETIQAPSVTKTFLQWWSWFHSLSKEVFGSLPMRAPP